MAQARLAPQRGASSTTPIAKAATRTTRISYLPAIDGMRAIAVLGVLLFHSDLLSGGFLGVDLFFVVSGYLITSLLLAEFRENARIDLREFWGRRARRLMPALFVTIGVVILYTAVFAAPTQLHRIREDGIATIFYAANWLSIFAKHTYWDAFGPKPPFSHMWSLAIEEQFYFVWPVVVMVLLRATRGSVRTILRISVVGALASGAWMVWLRIGATGGPDRVYFGSDTRASAILVGAAFACWAFLHPLMERSRRQALALCTLPVVVFLCATWVMADYSQAWLYLGGMFACGLAVVVLIASIVHLPKGPLARALSSETLVWIGLRSYAIYLFHVPVHLVLTPQRMGLDGWALFIVQTGVVLAMAAASYRFIENPIRRRRFPLSKIAIVWAGAAAAAVVGLILVTTGAQAASARSVVKGAGHVRILVVGDSVAGNLGDALAVGHDFTVLNETMDGCGIFSPTRTRNGTQVYDVLPACQVWADRWKSAVATFHPDVALMEVGGWDQVDQELRGKFVAPCDAAYQARYRAQLHLAMGLLSTGGAKVGILTTPNSTQASSTRQGCVNALYKAAPDSEPAAFVIDIDHYLCSANGCAQKIDGVALYSDGIHFSAAGGQAVRPWLASQVLAAVGSQPTGGASSSPGGDAAPGDTVAPGAPTASDLMALLPAASDVSGLARKLGRPAPSLDPSDPVSLSARKASAAFALSNDVGKLLRSKLSSAIRVGWASSGVTTIVLDLDSDRAAGSYTQALIQSRFDVGYGYGHSSNPAIATIVPPSGPGPSDWLTVVRLPRLVIVTWGPSSAHDVVDGLAKLIYRTAGTA